MKRTIGLALMLLLLALSLTACRSSGNGKTTPMPVQTTEQKEETKEIKGVVNKLDTYLVLLTDDGEYHVMDYGEGVSGDGLSEGDKVNVTYTGTLDDANHTPVITAIEKTE